jgi:glycosyltransferase involved in cell wall biosynthesis
MGTQPLISILIRTTLGRLELLDRCLRSVYSQTYSNVNVIICHDYYDFPKIPSFYVKPNLALGTYYYNDYCNFLKGKVANGWFFFLDDDDYLVDATALERIAQNFEGNSAIICQMSRDNGKVKPSDELMDLRQITSGRIGLPCLVLHSDHIALADIAPVENGDYLWIKSITNAVEPKFVKEVLVHSPKRSFGL